MATPSKQSKIDDSDNATGYIMNVTPVKTSKKGFPYFNAEIQEADKTSSIVCFSDRRRNEMKVFEDQR